MKAKRPNLPAKQRRFLKRAHRRINPASKASGKRKRRSGGDELSDAITGLLVRSALDFLTAVLGPYAGASEYSATDVAKPAGLLNDAKTIDLQPGKDFTEV